MGECERILKMAEERHKRLEKAIGLDFDTDVELDKMDGITNQEYIQNCTTEQLAEFLVEIVCGEELKKHIKKMGYINMHSYQTEMREWLKEKHTDG